MSGFNIERLINLNSFNQGLSENETLSLSLPAGTTVDLDFESYCYYYTDNTYNNDEISSILNSKNHTNKVAAPINRWANYNAFHNVEGYQKNYSDFGTSCNKNYFHRSGSDLIYDTFFKQDFLPPITNNLSSNSSFHNFEGQNKNKVRSIVLFLRANLGKSIANNFKEEVESLGAYVFIADNSRELLEVNSELDGCKRLIVTSADVALNEKLPEEISKKKWSNFLGIVLYCGPHAEYHIKWCSRVSTIKFLSQNLIEVRRAISWLFSESGVNTNEVPNIGRRGKKVGLQEIKKPTQSKTHATNNEFPSLGMQSITNKAICENDDNATSTGHYSPFGMNNANPHENIASMFRALAIETKIASQVNNGQFFNIDN
ncbi:hypothetical protein HWI79_740 [Cryptosporidium felis]|nr:hypothetical protein HWI79_740 [Cryptosporidium felis]